MARRANRCGSRFSWGALALVGIAFAQLAALSSSAPAERTRTAGGFTFRLDHFQCYRADPLTAFPPRLVGLVDQFSRSKPLVTALISLCAPVRKNNGLVRNRQAHLACYSLRALTFHPRWVVILNRFGHPRLVVFRPDSLCVPSLKRSLLPDLTASSLTRRRSSAVRVAEAPASQPSTSPSRTLALRPFRGHFRSGLRPTPVSRTTSPPKRIPARSCANK
jgi:hypothetical protein